MDTRDYLIEDRHFLVQALAGLVEIEQQRIVKGGIATKSQLKSLSSIASYLVDLAKKQQKTSVPLNTLANLCTMLKSIQLPGDFEKYTIGSGPGDLGEKFYIALDLPYEGEQFYDLSSILKKRDEKEEDKDEEEKNEKESEECECDCGCMECSASDKTELVINAVSKCLHKIARSLGDSGNHEAAYLVERTIQKFALLK